MIICSLQPILETVYAIWWAHAHCSQFKERCTLVLKFGKHSKVTCPGRTWLRAVALKNSPKQGSRSFKWCARRTSKSLAKLTIVTLRITYSTNVLIRSSTYLLYLIDMYLRCLRIGSHTARTRTMFLCFVVFLSVRVNTVLNTLHQDFLPRLFDRQVVKLSAKWWPSRTRALFLCFVVFLSVRVNTV